MWVEAISFGLVSALIRCFPQMESMACDSAFSKQTIWQGKLGLAKLAEYKRKRDPKKTPEPFAARSAGKEPIFVVQRHDARRLHYDFRLERDGALASWAVPKGVPLEPGQQHLAVHVEDHPLEYATFEGEIPKGQYGAGTVEIWDNGTYELVEEKKNGGLTVRLHGEAPRRDVWTLVPAQLAGDEKNWLIVRKQGRRGAGRRSAAPYAPMLATLDEERAEGRRLAVRDQVGRLPRSSPRSPAARSSSGPQGQRLTERFENVAKELVQGAARRPTASSTARSARSTSKGGRASPRCSRASAGRRSSTTSSTCSRSTASRSSTSRSTERRKRLERLLDKREQDRPLLGDLRRRRRAARGRRTQQGLEGIMAKRARLAVPARQAHARLAEDQGARPAGVRDRRLHARRGAARRARSARSCSAVNEGGGARLRRQRRHRLQRPRDRPPARQAEAARARRRRRSRASRRCRACARATSSGSSRSSSPRSSSPSGRTTAGCARPSYKGLREDKAAAEVRREEPSRSPTEMRKGKRKLKLSNLDKLFWPDEGITKGDLLAYYRRRGAGARPAPQGPAVHDEALPRRLAGQVLLPEGRAQAHAGLDPDRVDRRLDARQAAAARRIERAARQRRARAALDGEHGLHRPEHVVLAGRQARPARLGALRPRPVAGRRVSPRRSRSRCSSRRCSTRSASRASPRRAARTGCTSSCRSRAATRTPTRASSPRSSPARSRARTAGS